MSSALPRLSLLASVLVVVAGCGGSGGNTGGGGGGQAPTLVTFTISGSTPTAVATQVGSGAFTAATLTSGKMTLSLPDGTTNFAVAYLCPGFSLGPNFTESQEYLKYASSLDGTEYGGACFGDGTTGPVGGQHANWDADGQRGCWFLFGGKRAFCVGVGGKFRVWTILQPDPQRRL
jgi:hypothetical protein